MVGLHGWTNLDFKQVEIETKEELMIIKYAWRSRFESFITAILKVALQRNEESLACIITAYYELNVTRELIFKAITNDHFQWLKYLWAFTKNVIGSRINNGIWNLHSLFKDIISLEQEDKIA